MKLFACLCATLCAVMTIIVFSLISTSPDVIRGNDTSISLTGGNKNVVYTLILDDLRFLKNNDVKVQLVSIPASQEARVEAVYSEKLDDYGFSVDISNAEIRLSMDAAVSHPIKTFDVIIYATVHHVQASGSGYRLVIDNQIQNTFSMYLTGDVYTTLTLHGGPDFVLASAGSSTIDISGKSNSAVIALSGSTTVFGEYFECASADVRIAGSGKAYIAVKENLEVVLKGHSQLEYTGNPRLEKKGIDLSATLTQVLP